MTNLFIGLLIGILIGATVGSLGVAVQALRHEIHRLNKELMEAQDEKET
jgi:glucose-6-phosphate-specific signal transduction histidine kinase